MPQPTNATNICYKTPSKPNIQTDSHTNVNVCLSEYAPIKFLYRVGGSNYSVIMAEKLKRMPATATTTTTPPLPLRQCRGTQFEYHNLLTTKNTKFNTVNGWLLA